MDVEKACEIMGSAWSVLQNSIPGAVSALVATLFIRRNSSISEFEKLKQGKFAEVVDELLGKREITYVEYYKCRNFLNIAKIADKYYSNINLNRGNDNTEKEFDFDWFFRFFDAASNVTDEQMKDLWARILAGEITHPGTFSFRTIETLHNLSRSEAEIFAEIIQFTLKISGHPFIINNQELLGKYMGGVERLMLLTECGLLMTGSVLQRRTVSVNSNTLVFDNDVVYCLAKNKNNIAGELNINTIPFTQVGIDLFYLIYDDIRISFEFALEAVKAVKLENPDIIITANAYQNTENGLMLAEIQI
ncbi:DUF2806 domain-containing protein [uncultured Thomasclavelia sp.]|uniref:DUF2806 domain-containing protein n=1 Tax=uncultured Thomasclavelia sp. TaxID=3025759 RepID=UPI00280BD66A|nr:DUF2806 domain-containing protein [uncultured Thomasclavelia sp.]